MPEIISLCYQPAPSLNEPPFRFNRVPADSVNLIANHGIEGDRKARRSSNRQLNILSYETVQELAEEGYKVAPGELGEQIVISGVDLMTLQFGERLQIGDSAIIEIRKPRTPCDWFELIQNKPEEQARGRVGVMAKVLTGGVVRVGDPVTVLETITA